MHFWSFSNRYLVNRKLQKILLLEHSLLYVNEQFVLTTFSVNEEKHYMKKLNFLLKQCSSTIFSQGVLELVAHIRVD